MHDVRDGGVPTLRLSRHVDGDVTVTDRTSAAVVDPGSYTVQAMSVRKNRGHWASGRNRWLVEYEPAADDGDGDSGDDA